MESIRNYILSITASALLCGIVTSIMGEKGTAAALTKVICGIIMAMVVVSPLMQVNLSGWTDWTARLTFQAEAAAAEGELLGEEMLEAIIKEETESYILDKAGALGAALTADVTVKDGLPERVLLTGTVSPYAKAQLTAWIRDELGIAKEDQQWNGSPG